MTDLNNDRELRTRISELEYKLGQERASRTRAIALWTYTARLRGADPLGDFFDRMEGAHLGEGRGLEVPEFPGIDIDCVRGCSEAYRAAIQRAKAEPDETEQNLLWQAAVLESQDCMEGCVGGPPEDPRTHELPR